MRAPEDPVEVSGDHDGSSSSTGGSGASDCRCDNIADRDEKAEMREVATLISGFILDVDLAGASRLFRAIEVIGRSVPLVLSSSAPDRWIMIIPYPWRESMFRP